VVSLSNLIRTVCGSCSSSGKVGGGGVQWATLGDEINLVSQTGQEV
jgi:hypothetical protein